MPTIINLLLIIGLSLLGQVSFAASIAMNEVVSGMFLGQHMTIFSPEKPTSPEDILKQYRAGLGRRSLESKPNFGISPKEHWAVLTITNNSGEKDLIFENTFGLIDHFLIYKIQDEKAVLLYQGGDQNPFSERSWLHRSNNKQIHFKHGVLTLLFKVQGETVNIFIPRVWEPKDYRNLLVFEYSVFGLIFGVLVGMIFYNLFLAISLKNKLYFIYVSFVTFNAIFLLSNYNFGQMFSYLLFGFETYSNHIQLIMADLSVLSGVAFSWKYLDIEKSYLRKARPFLYIIFSWIASDIFFLHHISDWYTTISTLSVSIFCITVFITLGVLRMREGYRPAFYYLLAWFAYLIGTGDLILVYLGFAPMTAHGYWGQLVGSCIEVTLFSIALGSRINFITTQSAEKIAKLNDELIASNLSLESKVIERTRDIKDILGNIPQGIFTLSDRITIDPDYSLYLEKLFSTKNLAGKNLIQILSDRLLMPSDAIDQWQAALDSILGEDPIAFVCNEHLLPKQLILADSSQSRKILELDWHQISKENGANRLLVAVRDITEKSELIKAVADTSRELTLISQLVDIDPARFAKFERVGNELLHDIEECLDQSGNDELRQRRLLIALHTLKGMSRSLGLLELSNELHEAEAHVKDIFLDGTSSDIKDLHIVLKNVTRRFQEYQRVNKEKLGRFVDPDFLQVSRRVLSRVLDQIEAYPNKDPQFIEDIANLRRHYVQLLEDMVFAQLDAIKQLCDERHCPLPKLELRNKYFGIDPEAANELEKAMIHLIRNSIAHGIETPSSRSKKGKPERASIIIEHCLEQNRLLITYRDDGRGVDLEELRDKILDPNQQTKPISTDDILEGLFQAGFTTKVTADSLAGRGVGLDAVRAFLSKIGATINAKCGLRYADGRFEIIFEIRLPANTWHLIAESSNAA